MLSPRRLRPSRALGAVVACALGVALTACGAEGEGIGTAREASVCATGAVVQGADVSEYQSKVDWASVKASGRGFGIARISDGADIDTEFATNWPAMKAAGLIRGGYQFFEPSDDPATDAAVVVNAVGKLGDGDLPVTADMEVTGGQDSATIVAHLQTWMSLVTAGTGKVPMVYTAAGYWDASVNSTAFSSNPLWAANWGVSCPTLAAGWSTWTFWQYTATGTVSGVSTTDDLDEFNGDLAALQAFASGGSALVYGAQFVSQSWPLASTTMTMTAGQVIPATLTLKNIGTATWDANTRIGTTEPRDRASAFAAADWISTSRPAGVTGTVAPGQTYTFQFEFKAPSVPGAYDEHFGLVEEGVAWFGDPGEGGPPDSDLEVKVEVVAGDGGGSGSASTSSSPTTSTSTSTSASPTTSASTSSSPTTSTSTSASPTTSASTSSSPTANASGAGGASGEETSSTGEGCSCRVGDGEGGAGIAVAWLAAAAMVAGARRPRGCSRAPTITERRDPDS